ncbi:RNA polymerase sporulation sigma factor SigK [Sulfobacillus sp. DSM 109850]|uniref:RNA polymerase sigma factor n=1 Tax=Sulfobacillus harzensis TaxID=2729629 RepID=A0A7Y0Q2I1_9FIRM|nr:RNA polymerase sporulation sigma factor SigK [Sulfobacillus harzensis]NMP21184.1 RNA polymerase sporulation sigma factor SigK [Sulfobacillus harzensis]
MGSIGALILVVVAAIRGAVWLAGYIGGNAFPQPLSEDEERLALERLKGGDLEARRLLIEHNLRLVAHVVKKYHNSGEDPDDLISIGTIGLIKGIDSFDPDKGVRLATYCARCIDNEVLMHLRLRKKTNREVSLYDPIGVDREGNEISLLDVLGTEGDVVADAVELDVVMEWVRDFVQDLTPKEKLVLDLRFGLHGHQRLTQRDIAKKLGISRSYVSRIEKRAVRKILREMAEGRRSDEK